MKKTELRRRAKRVAGRIRADLNGRSGFDIGYLDREIQRDMLEAWASAVIAEFSDLLKGGQDVAGAEEGTRGG
jgi:hypothetical protein